MSVSSYWHVEGILLKTDKPIAVNHKSGVTLTSQPHLHCFRDEEHIEARCT